MQFQVQPISLKPRLGARNYFDCFESSVGGLLSYCLGGQDLVKPLYCLFDCCAISTDFHGVTSLCPRAADVNALILQAFGFRREALRYNGDLGVLQSVAGPFYVDFDEYYFHGYHHYRRVHFRHASLCSQVDMVGKLTILDPVLDFTRDTGYDSNFLSIPSDINGTDALLFVYLKSASTPSKSPIELSRQLLSIIPKENLAAWKCTDTNTDGAIEHSFGLMAYKKFLVLLRNRMGNLLGADHFYRWIFPLVWKLEYLNELHSHEEACVRERNLLSDWIDKMEKLEVILLRLTSSRSEILWTSALKRWEEILSIAEEYLILEERRIGS